MTKTVALLPCPFCNSDDVAADFTGDCWDVTCLNCHAGTIACGPAEADQHSAIAAWNSRTQTEQQLREEVEDALVKAYIAGATDVHEAWMEADEEKPWGYSPPDFTEAAHDYARSSLSSSSLTK